MNSTLNIALDNLTLAFQPIVRIVNEDTFEISDYEVLLRSKDKKSFPATIFEKIVNNESCNQMFWEWFTLEIKKVLTDKKVNVELVIEGIEDNIAAKEMLCHNIKLQQGFFWQVPQDYISPKEVHSFKEFE
ncbi:hypothetical protein [Ligilactobacillus salivarius]|uniref:hypothetical protein n=1 Tax=Ligilactobacillus salivarius TaxID=1624 RepID=UPI0013714ECD|nr:hypothetical protein [Ligilactobacillus salivarius]MYZ73299.1 hypothetical protein [Ligilactobacillus salivarius]